MSISINSNSTAVNAQRNLGMTSMKMGKVLEKLSSGYRINRAADDAAGLGISEKMRAQIRGNTQAIRNANDGISMIQTAEGAMDETHQILQRMRELGVQAANDTNDTAARTSIGTELVQLRSEIDRIANATEFNGQSLLTGTLSGTLGGASASDLVVGDAVDQAMVTSIDVSGAKAGTFTFSSSAANKITLTSANGQAQEIDISDMAALESQTLDFNQLGVKVNLASTLGETAANLITDFVTAANNTVLVTGTGAAKLQIGANTTINDTLSVAFNDVRATSTGGLNLVDTVTVDWSSSATIVDSNDSAQALIGQLDAAITTLNTRRSDLGATQNRIEHTVNSLGISVENLTASESRIRDADVAKLSSDLVSKQILQQAGVAMLSQANQMPQAVSQLLRA